MTILQRATFSGTPHADVRPGAYTKTATVEGIIKDQAYLYERITNLAVPDAASALATGHDHSGDGDGAVIRLPICQQWMSALLLRQTANPVQSNVNYAGWSKLIWHPFYCQPGLDKMMCVVWVDRETYGYSESFRAIMQDSSLDPIGTYQVANGLRDYLISESDEIGLIYTLETTPDAINVLVLEAWDGYYDSSVPVDTTTIGELLPEFRRVMGFTLSPEIRKPNKNLSSYSQSTVSTTTVTVPSTYISFDDALIADDIGLSSYHLVNMAKDDAMINELATNNPAGNNAASVVDGHNHQGDSTLSGCGVALQRTIGSWFYGTIRTPINGTKANYGDLDTIGAGTIPNRWTGGVNAITINSTAGTTTRTVATHFFRMPELTAAELLATTGSINVVVMVYVDASKADLTVGVSIGNASGASFGTESTHTFNVTGRYVYTFRAIDASALSAGGAIGTLRIRMTNSSNSSGSSFLYGSSVFYQP